VVHLDISTLTEHARFITPDGQQALVMFAMLAGFAVKVPLFPVHTWLPLAHTEAPTAGSVILAGVLLKLGTYAMYRFVLPFTPEAVYEYAPAIGVLSDHRHRLRGAHLLGAERRQEARRVLVGEPPRVLRARAVRAQHGTGITGVVLYMINHGLSTGALFLLIGFMYERYHTRDMREIGGLASKMPVWSFFMVFFVMASVGLPGLNGFVSEFLCVMGAFQSYTPWTARAATTMVRARPGARSARGSLRRRRRA
jgi:NADH-quinone oxidoreductase subunit M